MKAIKLIKQYFCTLDLSDKVNFYFRKNSKFTNLLRSIVKSIPLKSLRLFLSSRLIGSIFLINKKLNDHFKIFKFKNYQILFISNI